MNKARRKLKKRTIQKIKQREYNMLVKETKKQVEETNKRLKNLERQYKVGTWASGKLKTRIRNNKTKGLFYKGKRIKLKSKMTKTDLIQVQKATKQFLASATSTRSGIERVRGETIESLSSELNLEREDKIPISDVETMYNMLADKDFDRFNYKRKGRESDFIGASALWSEIDYAERNNLSKETFVERLQNLREQDFSDDDRLAAERIYEKYVL
jgi:hypothetical protein